MRCLGLPRFENHADILGRGADPDEREAVEQPDPDVMANPDIRTRQLVREVLRPSFEVLGAHRGGHGRSARDRGGYLPCDGEDGPPLRGEPTGRSQSAVDLRRPTPPQPVETAAAYRAHPPRAADPPRRGGRARIERRRDRRPTPRANLERVEAQA